ncbi:hypothetical protein EXIGLDRAFT_773070 [Exidia glandulosa HHB12029]|uniref:Uncharacterized protein n=1 Tax=Exidia glandulosa HHB12029 TaxID=1314781 RepID=A0A165EZ14_EXIGL|nr:hypothetical protein EXIGLDRAFT_773070 [Exidia glandulosa HHB12029]
MSRTKRARSPAAESEVELHSPTRRRIRYNKPRVHARPLACAYDDSDDDSLTSSDADDSADGLDTEGLEIVFEEHPSDTDATIPAGSPSRESLHPPAWTSAYTPSASRTPSEPRPEPIADRLRRMARELRDESIGPVNVSNGSVPHNGAAHLQRYNSPQTRDDPYVKNSAYLRSILDEGQLGVYIDSGNNLFIRIVDCAPSDDTGDKDVPTPPTQTPKTTTRCVRVQPPPNQR